MIHATDCLLSTLWRASWQGGLALLVVWLLCRVLARRLTADAHCWLWRLGYVKFLLGLIWGGAVLVPLLSAAPRPAVIQSHPLSVAYRYSAGQSGAGAGAVPPPFVQPVAGPPLGWQEGLAAAYVVGVAICLGRLLYAARRTRRILRHAAPNVTEWEIACAAGLARTMGLRHVPVLARSAEVDSPVLIAGRVLLPSEAQYGEAELRMILGHELAHARRRDLLWEWLGTLVQVTFFFHPLVVLARREERLAREAAADALALRTTGAAAADYGSLLLSLSLGQAGPRLPLVGAVGVIEGGSPLRRRLLALRDGAARTDTRRTRWRIALTLLPLLALVFVPWQMTHGQAPPPAPAPTAVAPAFPKMPHGDKRIVGTVRDEMGKPVAGLTVGLVRETNAESDAAGQAVTDAQGRFTFPKLPSGQFECQVLPEYGPGSSGQLVPLTIAQNINVTLRDSDREQDLSVKISPGVLVRGRVVDAQTGQPVMGIYVDSGSVPAGSGPADWERWTGASGSTTDAQGRYLVRVMPGNFFVRSVQVTGGSLMKERVRPAERAGHTSPGQTAFLPDISVFFNPIIVFTGPDGQPVANTPIRFTPADLGRGGLTIDEHADKTGTVVLFYYERGSFSVSQNGLYASGTYHWSPGQPLVIEENGQTLNFPDGIGRVQLTAGSSAAITGRVISEAGGPVPNALVTVFETDPKSHYGLGEQPFKTDAAGNFHAPLNPSGEYQASIRADGFNQVMVSRSPLPLVKGQTTDLGTIRLVHAAGVVAGRIVDQSGKPMPGILAAVRGQQTGGSAALTDAQGRFRIPNVVPGEPLHLTLCQKGEVPDSGEALYQSNEQMDFSGVQAGPTEREIVWHPQSGGY